ncbi:MAG TPA: ferrous iron transport protein B [Phycisphaerae bacterium]|mgnify:CR=1 FL=1|jgi:ferrous iron transport protein B|nr:ferrous iron transport protein B [Phycisphaerae bacterium]HOB74975.1 ferrous iron transport protein B [Phycisphaerae bacterium]HOJ55765.1 ferrous iron transport protein B [Phycisphaerae bacterium]HOL25748.1 ferrous iron transport protein B [Phycisphaerae bacterium]HPP19559.1 ferrous iron transport protein B [Phycisphaerae bacterium]
MSICAADPSVSGGQRIFTIAVMGNPNCGKTTLFNALTGLRHKVGNYPGVTVEKREGAVSGEPSLRLLDLPGTYSLSARSPDEQIARDVLLGCLEDTPRPDGVLIVIDATNLERNLYLASQVLELGLPAVIACNMMDLLREAGHELDIRELSQRLQAPVIPTIGHRGVGIDKLKAALRDLCTAQRSVNRPRQWSLHEELEKEVRHVAAAMTASGFASPEGANGAALLFLSERELPANDHLPSLVSHSLSEAQERLRVHPELDVSLEVTAGRYAWLGELVDACLKRSERNLHGATDKLDRIFTHKVWGLVCFAAMMGLLFYSIFVLARPLMGLIETGVEGLQQFTARHLAAGPLRDLLTDGVIAGVGNVIVFFPQICILFLFIALLEDTGYMARAAFLMERIMSRVGLPGKSFIPLLSSHACAIPGIMATRVIENPKDRLATILVAPLMSCSARLPVYTVLIAACLPGNPWTKATVLLSMYGLGLITALTMATVFKKTILRGPTPAFIMELPPYRVPRLSAVLFVMWDRSKVFLTRAGTIILAITILLWAATHYPQNAQRAAHYEAQREAVLASGAADAESRLEAIAREEAADQLQHSYAGRLGRLIEPVIRPLGYDWRIGIGLVASFAAREAFVSTMGVVYGVGEADEATPSLHKRLREAQWPDGRPLFTPLVAVGLMVFYVLACQCVSTIAVVRRETNSWRWPAFQLAYMTGLAYMGALLVYQVGSALGIGS